MNNIKTILISKKPLPFNKIGSWTSMYNYYLKQEHKIDYIICPKPELEEKSLIYKTSEPNIFQKITYKYFKINSNKHILDKISSLVEKNTKYIIQFIDDFGAVTFIAENLNKRFAKDKFYYQFFYHGYAPFYGNSQSRKFYETIDEMVLLTHQSYKEHIKYYTVLPCKFSILNNGIDTKFFKTLTNNQLNDLRIKENIKQDKKILLWLSQDRPKKGLDFIINVWKNIDDKLKSDSELWIIGSNREFNYLGVKSFGRIPNNQLPKYYQMANIYLFPTLCQEGFGLSLVEALHCGCYPIASSLGGVAEVLKDGEFGKLIQNPHFENEWKNEIETILKKDASKIKSNFNQELYTLKEWSLNMNSLIENAKKTLS